MSSCSELVPAFEAHLPHPGLCGEAFQASSPEPQPLQSIPAFFSVKQPCLPPSCSSSDDPLKPSMMPALDDDTFPPLVPSSKNSNISAHERVCEPSLPSLPDSPTLWSSHFTQNSNQTPPSKPKNKLSFIQPEIRESGKVGVCPPRSSAGEIEDLKLSAVGFFMGHRPGFIFVKNALTKQWKTKGAVEFHLLMHGGFLFTFSDAEDRERILETGMFYVGGRPIFVREWERHIHSGAMGLKSLPLWITLPGLPLHLWGDEALSVVCSCLGKPLYADQTTQVKTRRAFARVCIEISAGEKLEQKIQVEDDEGNLFLQPVVYEWTPPQCLDCKIFGHDLLSCPQRPKISTPPVADVSIGDEVPSKISEKLGVKQSDNRGESGIFRPYGKNRRRVRKMQQADSDRGIRITLDPAEKGASIFKHSDPLPQDKALPAEPDPKPMPPVSILNPQSRIHATSIPTHQNQFDPIANLSNFEGCVDPLLSPTERHPSPSIKQPVPANVSNIEGCDDPSFSPTERHPSPSKKQPDPKPLPPVLPLNPQPSFHATSIPPYLNPFDPIANLSDNDENDDFEDPTFSPAERHLPPSNKQSETSKLTPRITRSKARAQRSASATMIPSHPKTLNPGPSLNPLSISLRPSVTSQHRAKLPTFPFSRLAILEPSISPSLIPVPNSCEEPYPVAVHQAIPGSESGEPRAVESESWDSDSESQLSDDWGSLNKDHLTKTGGSVTEGGMKVRSPKTVRVSSTRSD